MAEGSGDREFLEVYSTIYRKAVKDFSPDIILVSAGYDLHADDPLTGLEVSDEGVRGIVEEIADSALSLKVPILFTLEGGYNLNALERCSRITFESLLGG
jgi:acetoin utilization deacetylase AcuC-like enzyme